MRSHADCSRAEVDDLYLGRMIRAAEMMRIRLEKELAKRLRIPRAFRQLDGQLECLANVAHVERVLKAHGSDIETAPREFRTFDAHVPSQRRRERVAIERRESRPEGFDAFVALIGREQAQRRQVAGQDGHQDLANADFFGDLRGVHGTSAAEGHEHEFGRIVAALDRNLADGIRHLRHGDAHDALGHLFDARYPQAGAQCRYGGSRALDVRTYRTTEQPRAEPPEHDVGVGDGGFVAPTPVTRRPRVGPGAAGSHPQRVTRFDVGDAAATGAHGIDGHRAALDRIAGECCFAD